MDPVDVIEGRVSALDRADIDTDQIIPKQFLKRVERTGFGEFLFYDWLRDGEITLEPNPILVAGRNFGSGSSREHAVWALRQFGFEAVVAPSFSDIFYGNCTKNGLLPVILEAEDCRALAAAGEARIDVDEQTVTFADGVFRFEIDAEIKRRVLGGLDDIAVTLQDEAAIAAYEDSGAAGRGPVTTELRYRGRAVSRPVDWDAGTYHRVASNQEEWGAEVLERLELSGDETVLDAGCGSGRVTRLLLERLPHGRVIGVDAAPSMIEEARANLDAFGDRVELRVADLTELELDEPADAVFSNATFHWIDDHVLLFRRLNDALLPGGQLEAQCGGEGNVAEWKRAVEATSGDERFAPYFRGLGQPYNFASVGDTETRLERSGFEVEAVWLENRVVEPPEPREYVRSVGLNPQLVRLPEGLRDEFIDAVLGSMLRPLRLAYVRLNISARRAAP